MTQTAESRAKRISREVEGRGIWKNAAETELLIARAIRSAENAALERAAIRASACGSIHGRRIAAEIRSLKSKPAPRRAKKANK